MIFKLGLENCCIHWKKNIFLTLLIAFLMFLGIFISTTFVKQYAQYAPFSELISGKGDVILTMDNTVRADDLKKGIAGAEEISSTGYINAFSDDERFDINGLDRYNGGYIPVLAEGVWFTKAERRADDSINAVISYNDNAFHAGDMLELKVADKDNSTVKIYICGVVAEDAQTIDTSSQKREKTGVFRFYNVINYMLEDPQLRFYDLFISKNDFERNFDNCLEKSRMLVKYKNDISDEELKNNRTYYEQHGAVIISDFEKLRDESKRYINSKTADVIPLAFGCLILTGISLAGVVMIDTRNRMREYAIYFMCGMKWTSCGLISAAGAGINAVLGFCLAVITGLAVRGAAGSEKLAFEFGICQIAVCGAIFMYVILISMLIPLHMMRKNTPAEVLRRAAI